MPTSRTPADSDHDDVARLDKLLRLALGTDRDGEAAAALAGCRRLLLQHGIRDLDGLRTWLLRSMPVRITTRGDHVKVDYHDGQGPVRFWWDEEEASIFGEQP